MNLNLAFQKTLQDERSVGVDHPAAGHHCGNLKSTANVVTSKAPQMPLNLLKLESGEPDTRRFSV